MKYFIKTSCAALFLMLNLQVFSQNLILIGGLNGSTIQVKNVLQGSTAEPKVNLGFHVGALLEVPLSKVVSINTGLMLESKGNKKLEGVPGDRFNTSLTPIYLDIPLNLRLSFEIQDLFRLYGQMGPYVGLGIGGRSAIDSNGVKVTESLFNSDQFDAFRRFDYGLNMGIGVQVDKVIVGFGFDLGMGNFRKPNITEDIYRNRTLKLSVGYILGQ